MLAPAAAQAPTAPAAQATHHSPRPAGSSVPDPQLAAAKQQLAALPAITAPGLPVQPVISSLAGVRDALTGARPQLVKVGASEWMLGEIDRVRGAATTLGDSLTALVSDGMKTFDPAFSADTPQWHAWFAEAADIVTRAESVAQAHSASH